MNLLGGFINYPTSEASLAGGQISFQARLTDRLLMLANMGPLNEIGLRGPLVSFADWTLGWAAHYRSDLYFTTLPTVGLVSPMGGYMPGGLGQGLELKLNGMRGLGGLNFFLSPVLGLMSNRTTAGAEGGVDWSLERLGLGYGLSARSNLLNPAQGAFAIANAEVQHSVGLRYSLDSRTYLQANYYYLLSDTYGLPVQTALAGIGMRLVGIPIAMAPVPAPTPVPTPVPVPTLSATPTPAHFTHLEGRLHSSLVPGGNPAQPLIVNLKRKVDGAFVHIATSTTTDVTGRYVLHDVLEEGEYQLVFRNPGMALENTVGVAVSEPVEVRLDRPVVRDMDVAWDEAAIDETHARGVETISWALKPGYDVLYHGVLRGDPDDSRTDVRSFPTLATLEPKGTFPISHRIKGRKLYHFVKFWQKGGTFKGGNYYGQSRPRPVQLP
ncbi:hypothetical protein D3C86_1272320 [compost metagenome]